jgi:hypothetical protein
MNKSEKMSDFFFHMVPYGGNRHHAVIIFQNYSIEPLVIEMYEIRPSKGI